MNTTDIVPFQQQITPTGETAANAVAAQAAAIVQARYLVAINRPRDIDVVREKLLKECKRPGFARVARYRKPIGQGIEGPSIRFAEAAIRCMTNIVTESLTTYDDREKRILQVSVTDLEANVPYTASITIEKTVERRKTKQGDTIIRQRENTRGETVFLIEATEDEILNKQNALVSKAIRTNGLRLVPGDIVEECMWQVVETQKNEDARDPDGAKLQLFDEFGKIGVTVAQIKTYLGHEGATLTPKELVDLRGLYSAIRDGETTWRAVMEQMNPDSVGAPKGTARSVDSFGPKPEAPKEEPTQPEPEKEAVAPTSEPDGIREGILKRILAAADDAGVMTGRFLGAIVGNNPKLDPATVKSFDDLDADTLDAVEENLEWYLSLAKGGKKK